MIDKDIVYLCNMLELTDCVVARNGMLFSSSLFTLSDKDYRLDIEYYIGGTTLKNIAAFIDNEGSLYILDNKDGKSILFTETKRYTNRELIVIKRKVSINNILS